MLQLAKFACELEISSQQNQAIQIVLAHINTLLSHAVKWEKEKGGISPFHLNVRRAEDERKFHRTGVDEDWAALSAQWFACVTHWIEL